MDAVDTKTKILDVAEKLFAEKGIQATSIRQIVKEAGLNVASIHYHFGSKEAVIQEIISRRIGPINQAKMKRLDEIEERTNGQTPDLEEVLRAFVEPHIHMKQVDRNQAKTIMKLMVQLDDNSVKSQLMHNSSMFDALHRYLNILHKILPMLSMAELQWRFKFMFGSIHVLMAEHSLPPDLPFQQHKFNNKEIIDCIITFLMAGMLAPPSIQNKDGYDD